MILVFQVLDASYYFLLCGMSKWQLARGAPYSIGCIDPAKRSDSTFYGFSLFAFTQKLGITLVVRDVLKCSKVKGALCRIELHLAFLMTYKKLRWSVQACVV